MPWGYIHNFWMVANQAALTWAKLLYSGVTAQKPMPVYAKHYWSATGKFVSLHLSFLDPKLLYIWLHTWTYLACIGSGLFGSYLDISGKVQIWQNKQRPFFLCLLLESPNIGVLKVQLETNIEETNDRFEIDIFMWAIGTHSQDGRSQ